MKVESTNLKNVYAAPKQSTSSKVNFQGVKVRVSDIENEINKLNSAPLRFVNKLRSNISEFQDICINALGTGLLAPIFIKYNPLSKTDKDTRTYSAWRQPVSAILAITTQGAITIPFTKLINNMANNGWFGEACNRSPYKNDKYYEKQVAMNNPHFDKKQIKAEAEKLQDLNKANLLNTLKTENTVKFYYKGKANPQNMNPENFKNLLTKTVDELLKNENEQLKRLQEEKLPNRIARSEFYRTHSSEAETLLNELSAKIKTLDENDVSKCLKKEYKALKKSKADKQLVNMVKETFILSEAGKDAALAKIDKMLEHIQKYKNTSSIEEVTQLCLESIQGRLNKHQDAINFLENVKNEIDKGKTVSDIETMFKEKVTQAKKAGRSFSLEDKTFSEEVLSKLKSLTNSHIDSVKRFSTLAVALATLPVTCWLLNWLYPRFMDAVFPNLSNKKHSNEAQELINKAGENKKAEVK